MKKNKSDKSGKYNWINKHHIIPKYVDKKSKDTVNLTLDEHCEIHEMTKGIKNKNQIYSLFFGWMNKNKNKA